MAYKVFISYSTRDLSFVEYVSTLLTYPAVEVFIAARNVFPGAPLASSIAEAIKGSDLFLLLWSRNSESSEWVPQEIGIAHGNSRPILPVVLEPGLPLPGFIRDLKYLEAYQNPVEALSQLQHIVLDNAQSLQQRQGLALLGAAVVGLLLLANRDR